MNGEKRWIGNASIANILIIWARDDDGRFGGFVIEEPQDVEGVTIEDLQGKIGKRSVLNAHITLKNVRVPVENRLEQLQAHWNMPRPVSSLASADPAEIGGDGNGSHPDADPLLPDGHSLGPRQTERGHYLDGEV